MTLEAVKEATTSCLKEISDNASIGALSACENTDAVFPTRKEAILKNFSYLYQYLQ